LRRLDCLRGLYAACRKALRATTTGLLPTKWPAFLAKALRQQRILDRTEEPFSPVKKKFPAQSWRVLTGISALGDRRTFRPTRKKEGNPFYENKNKKFS
jgi:hypothetical protein